MTKLAKNLSTDASNLMSKLLTTLDERVFFADLVQFLASCVGHDRVDAYLVQDDAMIRSIVENGGPCLKNDQQKAFGIINYVIRTKRPYFSNDISRDPLFGHLEDNKVRAEMCFPIAHEGVIIATVNLQIFHGTDLDFSQKDITLLTDILSGLKTPIANIKMYLEAKRLNDILLSQIALKEQELSKRQSEMVLVTGHVAEEKPVIGRSEVMNNLFKLADKLSCVATNFILEGERGTGKELLANRIHCRSSRKNKSFVVVDLRAIDQERIACELFGEEVAGMVSKRGAIELANGGTLVIRNLLSMPARIQSQLLGYLERRSFIREGGYQVYSSDIRIMVLSDINLGEAVQEGSLREDLYFALGKMTLKVPALRDRGSDIELMANYFLNFQRPANAQKTFSPAAIKLLKEYNWPGNIREMMSVVERAYILTEGIVVEKDQLMDRIQGNMPEKQQEEESEDVTTYIEMTLEELEQQHICRTLEYLDGNKTKTAKTLGITVKTLYNKLHNYGMIDEKEA